MKVTIMVIAICFINQLTYGQETRRVFTANAEKIEYDSLTNLIKMYPDSSELYSRRGELVFHLNINGNGKILNVSNSNALKDIQKAIEINPKKPIHYKILSDYYWYVNDDITTAITYIAKSIEVDKTNATWYHLSGFLKRKAALDKEACEDWVAGSKLQGDAAEKCKVFSELYCDK